MYPPVDKEDQSPLGPAARIPLLSELCLFGVGQACIYIADAVAKNGGSRPVVKWIQVSNNTEIWIYISYLCTTL